MRVLFMGTPDFAVPTLRAIYESEHEVIGVVTQPDKPKGRGGKMQFSPVKEVALEYNLKVYQPVKVRDEAFLFKLRELNPDVIVVVAFGQILSREILEAPQYGCLNVHASLLPKLRGAAPIQWSVIDGDEETGVTIMQMDDGIDTGDIILVKKYKLDRKETGGSLFEKLADLGGSMMVEVLGMAERGTIKKTPQDHSKHTYAKKLTKATGLLDFNKSAVELERLVRGLNPWPSAYTFVDGKMLKIWEADVLENVSDKDFKCENGCIIDIEKDSFVVKTAKGALIVKSVQLEGKKRMNCDAFLRGYPLSCGTILGKESE